MTVLIVAVVFAWIAILLLGLAVGGLMAQVRTLQARVQRRGSTPPAVAPDLFSDSPELAPSGPYSAVFVNSDCDVCHESLPKLLEKAHGAQIHVVADEASDEWASLPSSARLMVDPQAHIRSGIPAVPWFVAVDANGETAESFALGNPETIERAARVARGMRPAEMAETPQA